ncbi:MAG: long-chain-fatty-acid--CoA ligase [Actinobacteria bacterium]|nr:long-chain-fatty-acid--CoA ligase [Actinomycetota bacterium]
MKVPLTPLDFLERARRHFGPLEAVVETDGFNAGRRYTYSQFAERAHRLAHALRRGFHCQPGDRVAYLAPNTPELLEAYFGVVLAGCVLVPLNIRLSAAEVQRLVDDCSPSVLVVHPSLAGVAATVTGPRHLDIGPGYEALLEAQPPDLYDAVPPDEGSVCEIFYTSGTTGRPRGAMLTHRALATHAVDSALTLGIHHRDVQLHTSPLFHVNGWGTPHYITAVGARHVLCERFDPGVVLRCVETEGVTRRSIVPAMAQSILDHPDLPQRNVGSLRQVTIGGAPPPEGLIAALEKALDCEVVGGYGLTEASPQLTKALTLRSHDAAGSDTQMQRKATTGLPMVGVDLRVLDDEDREVVWDGITPGEICVRSNHVMAGYWGDQDATAEALRGGWLRTGDLATVNDEGYVMIIDRRKDVIVSGGENIASVEVEAALCAHPSVLEASVVAMPDQRWGEVPRAFVVLHPGMTASDEELKEAVRSRLARFKAPRVVELVEELPRNSTGKVLKADLRARPLPAATEIRS